MKMKKMLKGASLIELMVAIVLLSLVLSQFFFMQLGAVKLVEGANRAEIASELAQEKLDEYRSIPGEAISTGSTTTTEIFDGNKYTRKVVISQYSTSQNTKKIVVTIKWTQGGSWVRSLDMEGVLR